MLKEEIRLSTQSKIIGKNIHTFDLLDSTNLKAKSLLQEGEEEGTIVIAEEQTAGRGRMGRSWVSERGKNLTFSVVLKPQISPESIGIVSLYGGLAVAEAIQDQSHLHPECKWPNDVLLNGKKCCGILSEAVFKQGSLVGVVMGIGINVNQRVFTRELRATATSVRKNGCDTTPRLFHNRNRARPCP
ncbi:MAG: biotin--[acetyl-CoA-carboxylase] ligase [Ignavibacteriales bacterium]|nr:biotin--[acetyl-CoA-carboxylase] ligase [Ignavibacteriales bacterium]